MEGSLYATILLAMALRLAIHERTSHGLPKHLNNT